MRDIISVGILVNDIKIPQWVFCSLENLVRSGDARVTVLVVGTPKPANDRGKRHLISRLILKLVEKIDYLIFNRRHNYNRKRDFTEIEGISGVVDLRQKVNGEGAGNTSLADALTDLKPDVIVKFGEHKLDAQIREIPKYGIWCFSIDRADPPAGLDYGFWEVIRYKTASYSAVKRTGRDPASKETIYGSWESTCPFSININRNKLFFRAALFLPRLIAGIRIYGEEYLTWQKQRAAKNELPENESGDPLAFLRVLTDVCKSLVRVLGLVFNKLINTDAFSWQLLIDANSMGNSLEYDFSKFIKIKSPSGLFWADPFVVAGDGRYYVFVEEFIYWKNKAHISLLELDNNGSLIAQKRVIENPYHMSYPFVFMVGAYYYMIPETAGNKTIELYRCTDFPGKWQFEKYVMKDISATDTTLFQYDGKWWLFTTLDQTGSVSGGSTELFLFYSDDPLSENWKSHPLNPVVSDERTARCAGNLFIRDGEIFRPSQDCSMRYGRGLNINRVTLLNEKEYNEELVKEIKPDWDRKLKGVHTINFDKNFTIIDTYKFHRRI